MQDDEATFDMFLKGLSYWRECSGSTEYSWEQMQRIFAGVSHAYIMVKGNLKSQSEMDKLDSAFRAAELEHGMRQAYRLTMPLREIIHGKNARPAHD